MTDSLLDQNETDFVDPNKDYYEELVGEGRKYKDNQALARSRIEADLTIRARERALDELREDFNRMREEYNAGAKLEELINKMAQTQELHASSDDTHTANDDGKPTFTLEEVESLISNKLTQNKTEEQQRKNFEESKNKLIERYGSDYHSHYKSQIDALGLDEAYMNDLAKNKPQVFIRVLGLDQTNRGESFQTPPKSTTFVPKTTEKRTWSWYQKLRKENPTVYHNPKTQMQLMKDAAEFGDEFRDGDFSNY